MVFDGAADCWRSMIDAALADEPEETEEPDGE
jgi:hypothetical protein